MVLNEIALFANPEVFTRDPPSAGGGQRAVTLQGGSGLQVSRGRPSLRKRDAEVRVCERVRARERAGRQWLGSALPRSTKVFSMGVWLGSSSVKRFSLASWCCKRFSLASWCCVGGPSSTKGTLMCVRVCESVSVSVSVSVSCVFVCVV